MTDDIVTRLRDIANLRGDMGGHVIPLACLNAADEIERLQDEIEGLRKECFKWEENAKRFANRLNQALVDGEIKELGM